MDEQVATAVRFGTFVWGEHEIDLDRLPLAVQKYGIERLVKHKWDNETASLVFRQREKDKRTAEEYADEYQPLTVEIRNRMTEKLYKGEISTRIGGPRGNVVEAIAYALAKKRAEQTLRPKGLWPIKARGVGEDAPEPTIDFNGQEMTQEMLTDVVFEKYKEQFLADANVEWEKRKEKAKLAKANAVPVLKSTAQSVADLV